MNKDIKDIIEKFINLQGGKWIHIIVQGDGGKAEMVLPFGDLNTKEEPQAAEPISVDGIDFSGAEVVEINK